MFFFVLGASVRPYFGRLMCIRLRVFAPRAAAAVRGS